MWRLNGGERDNQEDISDDDNKCFTRPSTITIDSCTLQEDWKKKKCRTALVFIFSLEPVCSWRKPGNAAWIRYSISIITVIENKKNLLTFYAYFYFYSYYYYFRPRELWNWGSHKVTVTMHNLYSVNSPQGLWAFSSVSCRKSSHSVYFAAFPSKQINVNKE